MAYEKQDQKTYGQSETAKTYKKVVSTAREHFSPDKLQAYQKTLAKEGYVIIENVLNKAQLATIRASVSPWLNKKGRNAFEGALTQRIYSVIAKTLACNPLVEHPLILALLDELMSPGYLLSQLQVINILPGEDQQAIHYDDAYYQIPRPRPPLGAATVWALDDFTESNGATIVIPGSHAWGEKVPETADVERQIPCVMPAGSVVFFLGTLWHGGGANVSDQARLAVTAQYCQGFCRSQENFSLSVPPPIVAQCSESMKHLLGYSIFGPFMGMVDGMHPKRLLEPFNGHPKDQSPPAGSSPLRV